MGAIELIKSDLFRYAGTTSSKAFIKTYVKVFLLFLLMILTMEI